jgi:YD repeat-containing protein
VLQQVRDALGATLTNWFDASGRLAGSAGPTVTVTNAYDGENNLRFRTTILESGSFREEFQYDDLSYATNHIDALGNPEGSTVGLDGRVLQLRDKEGEVVTNSYTVLGEKLGESDPNGVRIEFSYDVNRKLAAVSDARGQSARNSFDFAGRLTGETLPDDAVNSYTNFTLLTAPSSATRTATCGWPSWISGACSRSV